MTEAGKNSLEAHNDEIDLIELVRVVWSKKWFIAKVTGVFVVLGLVIAFTSPKEYSTSCTLIPEAAGESGKFGGSLGGLASLAGLDLGGLAGGSQVINPALYQSVAQSTPFLLELMNQKFQFGEIEDEISMYEYYMKFYSTSLISKLLSAPSKLIGVFKSSASEDITEVRIISIVSLSKDQHRIINDLRERVLVTMDWDLNIVSIEVEMQDAMVAAQMAEFTRKYITKYVTNYSISKSQEQLEFIESQYVQRKKEFEIAQLKLATFRDRNTNVNSARARSEEERLQSEYNLAFNIYNQLAQQQESIKLQVNENTPVFTILEPVKVPLDKSKPKKMVILIISTFLGVLVSIIIISIKSLNFK